MEEKVCSNHDGVIPCCPICYDPKELVSKFCCSHKVCSECFIGQLKSKAGLVCSQCRSDICKDSLTKEENTIFEDREKEKVPGVIGFAVQFLRDVEYIYGESRDGPGAIPSWVFQNLADEDNPSFENLASSLQRPGLEVQNIRGGINIASNDGDIESVINFCVGFANASRNGNLDIVEPS